MNTTERKAHLSRAQAHVDAADILEQIFASAPRWRAVKRFLLRRWAAKEIVLAAEWMRLHDASLKKVATPQDLADAYTPPGARLTAAQSYRSGGIGPLITEYRRVRP